jgi:dipeptidyl-peptidase-3
MAWRMLVALHEITGHGSGKMNPRLDQDPRAYLKEYYSTLEEARADLVALWHIFDPKIKEIAGFATDEEWLGVARQMYDDYAVSALLQLRQVPGGTDYHEDHHRAIQLNVEYLRANFGAIEPLEKAGKVFFRVTDYDLMRRGVGELLAELMRIKAEGDYTNIRELVDRYAIRFDPAWRDQVIARAGACGMPRYTAMIMPHMVPVTDSAGVITDVRIKYDQDFLTQQREFARLQRIES